jgi:hypothetical protein
VRRIAEVHGAAIEARHSPLGGLRVRVRFDTATPMRAGANRETPTAGSINATTRA